MALIVLLLILAIATSGSVEGATFCICRPDVSDTASQTTIDYACGAGADCGPIHTNGVCYQPNTIKAHCSYAANSYYQRKVATGATCDFSGTAVLTSADPSSGQCIYPSSASAAGTSTTLTPATGTTPTTGGTPSTFSPTGGIIGVTPSSLGPSGMNTDLNAGFPSLGFATTSLFFTIWFWGLVQWALLWF